MKRRIFFIALCILMVNSFRNMNGCIITFTNDSMHTIRLLNVNDGTLSDIKHGKSRRIGNEHTLALIKVAIIPACENDVLTTETLT